MTTWGDYEMDDLFESGQAMTIPSSVVSILTDMGFTANDYTFAFGAAVFEGNRDKLVRSSTHNMISYAKKDTQL